MEYDVLIIGGGTSGCAAAYNCARFGLKTLLVEKNNFLGGLMSGGLVVPVMKSSVEDINCEYYKKLVKTAKKYNSQITYKDKNDGWFNPEMLKIVLDDVLTSAEVQNNLDILFEADILNVEVRDKNIKSVGLNHGALSIPIEAKHYIDATGYGKLARMSGCELLSDNEIKQQNSLRFIVSNVDVEKFTKFILEIDDNEDITNTYRSEQDTRNEIHFTTASTWDTSRHWALDKILKIGVKEGMLHEQDRSYFQLFSIAGGTGQVAFNCPRINNYQDNPYKASYELIEARRAIYRLFNFTKKYFKGFENAIITNIATQTGIREEGRIKSKYIYSKDDLISSKTFKNPVLRANYSIDVHSNKKDGSILQKTSTYELPLEALMSEDVDNLFVAGKIVGAEFEAHSALRVQKSCMQMGEAIAKYIANL